MKIRIIIIASAFVLPSCSKGQFDLGKINKEIDKTFNTKSLSSQDVIDGLKQALTIGGQNASTAASKADGYFKNPLIKIPFPSEAKEMENKLRSLGMNKEVDDFVLTINRAAEEAAKEAAPIFTNAIKSMTITDGMNILKGNDTAATNYLKQKTSLSLHDKFKPVILSATQKVKVTEYWNPLVSTYNKIPFVKRLNPDLEEYITQKSLTGLFYLISEEEIKIRKNPSARVTELLKKVFGNK